MQKTRKTSLSTRSGNSREGNQKYKCIEPKA